MDEEEQTYLGEKDLTDEMRIQFAIDELYAFLVSFEPTKKNIRKAWSMRNNIKNMSESNLKKYKNDLIITEFSEQLKKAKEKAIKDGILNKYKQWMNEIGVFQDYKGINVNIVDILSNQLIKMFRKSDVIKRGKTTNEN